MPDPNPDEWYCPMCLFAEQAAAEINTFWKLFGGRQLSSEELARLADLLREFFKDKGPLP